MKLIIRRLSVAVAALVSVLIIAGIGLRLHGQHRLAQMQARFERELGPLPGIPQNMTLESRQNTLGTESTARMERFRMAREAADASLAALEAADRQSAMTHFQELVRYRDEFLSEPALLGQLVGDGAGRKTILVARAFLDLPDLHPDEIEVLASALEAPSNDG